MVIVIMRISTADYSFAVDCGSNSSMTGTDNTVYDVDDTDLGLHRTMSPVKQDGVLAM
jgi:hypothetical protein